LLPADSALRLCRKSGRKFHGFDPLRPYLLGASALFIVYGFYQAWQSKRCSRRPSIVSSALLWISAFFVLVSIFFPQVLANAAADLLAR